MNKEHLTLPKIKGDYAYNCGSCDHSGHTPHIQETKFETWYYCEKCGGAVIPGELETCDECGETFSKEEDEDDYLCRTCREEVGYKCRVCEKEQVDEAGDVCFDCSGRC